MTATPPPPPNYAPNPFPKNWMGIVSISASASMLVLCWLLGPIPAIAGIVFGHLGRSAAKNGEANNDSLSKWGLIIGYVMLGLMVLAIVAYFAFLAFAIVASESTTY